ncbi:MAG: FecR domain-containing protein [Bordetella sp.]|nr:MAG: FecR domain-containing protein [Bordetella sp.]
MYSNADSKKNISSGSSITNHTKTSLQTRRHFLTKLFYSGIGGFCTIYIGNAFYPLSNIKADVATATGQRRFYQLMDGSQLLLDARSQANFNFNQALRQINLLNGALSIRVSKELDRPLIVYTGQGIIKTNQSRFMVRQQAQRTLVAVHDNFIQIETLNGEKKIVESGKGVRFDSYQIGIPRSEIVSEASWEKGSINAYGCPLVDVIEALRPYRAGPLRISAAAGGLPVFGNYSLDDTNATLSALQQRMPISIHYYGPLGVSIRVPPSSKRSINNFNEKIILKVFNLKDMTEIQKSLIIF